MLRINISKDAAKVILRLLPKHARQVSEKISALRENPNANDTKKMKGYPLNRVDVGEYRIIYTVVGNTLRVEVVGKRNDSQVYRMLKRKW